MPWHCFSRFLMKLTIILFEVCLVNAAFLDLVFWTLLQPIWTITGLGSIGLVNGTVHGLNFVLLFIDLFLNQLQVSLRILLACTITILFSVDSWRNLKCAVS